MADELVSKTTPGMQETLETATGTEIAPPKVEVCAGNETETRPSFTP